MTHIPFEAADRDAQPGCPDERRRGWRAGAALGRPEHGRRGHHHPGGHHPGGRGRGGSGRPHRGPGWRTLLSDAPTGTSAQELAEAFFGIGQLLRASVRSQHRGPRREAGLTFARAALLAALDSDGPQRMGELAHRLGVVPRTLTPMVDALADDGLVVREADPEDRRATLLRITEAGSAELVRTRSERSAVDEVFAALSEEERGGLAAILDKLRASARTGLVEPGTFGVSTAHGQEDDAYGEDPAEDGTDGDAPRHRRRHGHRFAPGRPRSGPEAFGDPGAHHHGPWGGSGTPWEHARAHGPRRSPSAGWRRAGR